MNKNHYVSLDIAKQLHEAEFEFPESEKAWANAEYRSTGTDEMMLFTTSMYSLFGGLEKEDIVSSRKHSSYNIFPAPSLSELLDKLPVGYFVQKINDINGKIAFICSDVREKAIFAGNYIESKTVPDAAALMLLKIRGEGVENGD